MSILMSTTMRHQEEAGVRLQGFLFIDGGYLRRQYRDVICKWTGGVAELDFSKISSIFGNPAKSFYYDCLDDINRKNETETELTARKEEQQKLFRKIRSIPGTHVRLGRLTGTENNRRQKEVDILLAVDMMEHATRQNMSSVTLIAGDGDFRPLVEAIVRLGLKITIAGFHKHTSSDLAEAADDYRKIKLSDCHQISNRSLQQNFPIPVLRDHGYKFNLEDYTSIYTGMILEEPLTFYKSNSDSAENGYMAIIKKEYGQRVYTFNNYDRLKLFLELQLMGGEVLDLNII